MVLGFDGSLNGDNTGIVVVTCTTPPHVGVAGLWERPPDTPGWEVPRGEVKQALRECCRRWDVKEIAYDPYLWIDAFEDLEAEGLPVVEFPQVRSSMAPATQRFYELVTTRGLTHTGDKRLARHLGNAVLKTDARGSRIVKDSPHSPRKIDLAVAAVMAVERASWWASNTVEWESTVCGYGHHSRQCSTLNSISPGDAKEPRGRCCPACPAGASAMPGLPWRR